MVRIAKRFGDMEPEILEPGYAGSVTPKVIDFIRHELRRRPGLRVRWGFREDQQRFADNDIKHVALLEVQHTKDCTCDWDWLKLQD